jgi:sarcosine oxidase subunit gamma
MATAFDLALPPPGRAATGRGVTALWVQPEGWLITAPRGEEGALGRAVKAACGGAAAVIDQSHGRSVVTLSGPRAAWVLAKLCRIDLHPVAFCAGHVAVTEIAHLSCTLHQTDAVPSYEMIVFSTFLKSFREALDHAAAG